MAIQNRYEFALLFDVKHGNPNGDPDAGNLPRVDPETGRGLVTDVCLKRKVRNYVTLTKELKPPYDIYVKEKSVLGRAHFDAFKKLGIELGEEARREVPNELHEQIESVTLPDGMTLEENEDGISQLIIAPITNKKEVKDWLKDSDLDKKLKNFINDAIKGVKSRPPKGEEVEKGRDEMCKSFFDVRTFGAVMSLKTAPNCGQVRGPVQMTFAHSIDPIIALEHTITRMAVATEAEAEKQHGDNRTMGRKYTVPYGLYRVHGFISAHLAKQTGFSDEDLSLFWAALHNMFDHDRSAARGEMTTRKLVVFQHDSALGNAPAHTLFDRIKVARKDISKPARDYSDYEVLLDESNMPSGVKILKTS